MKNDPIRISYVETRADSERARAELEEEWNVALDHAHDGRQNDMDMAYEYSADPTDEAIKNLARIKELQDMLRDWQNRWPSEHTEADCDGECERDHGEDRADSALEARYDQWKDDAA